MNVEQRIAIERKVVRHLIRSMKKEGWTISRIYDGGEPDEDILTPNETEAMEAVFAVDECRIYFQHGSGGKKHGVLIVLGNDGWDCISDWSYAKDNTNGFNALMEQVISYATALEMTA